MLLDTEKISINHTIVHLQDLKELCKQKGITLQDLLLYQLTNKIEELNNSIEYYTNTH